MVPERVRRILRVPGGFTTVELLVVIGIITILTTLSLPSFWTHIRTATLRAGAEELAAVLNGARQLAIRSNTTVCLSNDGTRAQYRLGGCSGPAWTGPGTDSSGQIRLASHLAISGPSHLCFNHLGSGSATPAPCTPNGTLTISHPSGQGTMHVIVATTGRVRIQ
jgi:Tfp pilus assembly protein FimT